MSRPLPICEPFAEVRVPFPLTDRAVQRGRRGLVVDGQEARQRRPVCLPGMCG
jgi:hypothetical protein